MTPATEGTLERSGLLTVPVLGALALVLGVLAASGGWPLWAALLVPLAGLAARAAGWRWGGRQSLVLAAALLLAPVGWLRLSAVAAAPDPLAGLEGQTLTLTGDSDGRYLASERGRVLVWPALPPGRWRVTGRLDPITTYRNPGSFDYRAWLERRGVRHRLWATSREQLPGGSLLEPLRAHLTAGARAGLGANEAAFMQALTLGSSDALADLEEAGPGLSWRDAFHRSGLAHILALSGQQVTLLVLCLTWALSRLGLWRYPLLIAFLAGYVTVVGPSPSVVRAGLMGSAVLASLWLGRGRLEALPALGLAAVLALLVEPRWVLDPGFQLSYLAVLGLVAFGPPVARLLRGRRRAVVYLGSGLAATLAAEALTLPLVASSFFAVPPAAPLANLVAEPLVAVLVPLGFAAAVLGPALGGVVNLVVGPLASSVLGAARLFAGLPTIPWGSVSAAGALAYFAAIAALGFALHGRLRPWQALAVCLAAVLATALPAARPAHEIVYLDVGQGDSTLVRLPAGDLLVDGGGTPRSDYGVGARVVEPALRALGVRRLLAVVATHADADHVEGLEHLLGAVPVGVLLVGHPKPPGEDAVWDRVMAAARRAGVPVQRVRRGQRLVLGEAVFTFLGPKARREPLDNANSVAAVLEYRGRRALFLGDTPSEIEAELYPGRVDIMGIAHHGSNGSNSDALLDRAQPRLAVVSSGRNTYGHPGADALSRLARRRVAVYRTDRDGAVRYDLETGTVRLENPNPEAGQPGEPGGRPGRRVEGAN